MSIDPNAVVLAGKVISGLNTDFELAKPDFSGEHLTIPPKDANPLYDPVEQISIDDLTTATVDGTAAFDQLMKSVKLHIDEQFDKHRINGDQFAKMYIELTTAAMSTASQIVLGRDTARWQAVLIQSQARRAEIEAVQAAVSLETAKAQHALVLMNVVNADAEWRRIRTSTELTEEQIASVISARALEASQKLMVEAQTVLVNEQVTSEEKKQEMLDAQIAVETERLNHIKAEVDLLEDNLLTEGAKRLNLTAQTATEGARKLHTEAETSLVSANVTTETTKRAHLTAQTAMVEAQTLSEAVNRSLTSSQKLLVDSQTLSEASKRLMVLEQIKLVGEQYESTRAQTLNTRSDAAAVSGILGKQKDLYTQQIKSYELDGQYKAVKMLSDAWVTQKTVDEGLTAPTVFANDAVNTVMRDFIGKNGLTVPAA